MTKTEKQLTISNAYLLIICLTLMSVSGNYLGAPLVFFCIIWNLGLLERLRDRAKKRVEWISEGVSKKVTLAYLLCDLLIIAVVLGLFIYTWYIAIW